MKVSKQFIKTMQDPFTHELIAFGWSDSNKQSYTIREAIAFVQSDVNLQEECPEVFGADYHEVINALLQYADLDKEYRPVDVLARIGLEVA